MIFRRPRWCRSANDAIACDKFVYSQNMFLYNIGRRVIASKGIADIIPQSISYYNPLVWLDRGCHGLSSLLTFLVTWTVGFILVPYLKDWRWHFRRSCGVVAQCYAVGLTIEVASSIRGWLRRLWASCSHTCVSMPTAIVTIWSRET